MGQPPVEGTVVDDAVPEVRRLPAGRAARETAVHRAEIRDMAAHVNAADDEAAPVTAATTELPEIESDAPAARSSGRAGVWVAVLAALALTLVVVLAKASAFSAEEAAETTRAPEVAQEPEPTATYSGPSTSIPQTDEQPASGNGNPYGLPASVVEQTFLESIHASGLSAYGPDSEQVELAHVMCGALDRGASSEDAMDALMSSGYSSTTAGAYFGLAVASFCPEHSTW
ncbi:DUF732 domain-containing protein [Geodermatophilus sp. SYSU D00696]